MTDLVKPELIEAIVGVKRHPIEHWGRLVSATIGRKERKYERFFILHSQMCVDSWIDLRECEYSLGLDWLIENGVGFDEGWRHPGPLQIRNGRLAPGR